MKNIRFNLKKIPQLLILCFTLVSMTILAGCNTNADSAYSDDRKLLVYTSFYPMYDFTSKIGGE